MAALRNVRWWHGSVVSSVIGMATIAVLGTGRMGSAIARRLLDTGHRVTVWNRTAEKTAPLVAAGARAAPTPAVPDAEVVITMLTDAAAVREVVTGADLRPGCVLVEMSTIGPAAVRDLRVPDGVEVVDAPVLGSVAAAASGRLTLLAGGKIERVRPVLEALGSVRHCGDLGSGAALKLVANDTMVVARAVGVDAEAALAVVGKGALAGAVARAGAVGAAFPVALAAKDLDLVLDFSSPPVVRAAAAVLREAPDRHADLGTIIRAAS
jgi:3-hydroxyisobutyrate dehydrogenase-like beta-hydroxyacid dehydrogenase